MTRYESWREVRSQHFPEVAFRVHRMSFGRRADLARRVRELTSRVEFHQAGDSAEDKLATSMISMEIDQLYLEFGLASIEGIEIDGELATCQSLIQLGPESLCREIILAVQAECGLNMDERKN